MKRIAKVIAISLSLYMSIEMVLGNSVSIKICPQERADDVERILDIDRTSRISEDEFLQHLVDLGFRYEKSLVERSLRKCPKVSPETYSNAYKIYGVSPSRDDIEIKDTDKLYIIIIVFIDFEHNVTAIEYVTIYSE